MTDFTVNGDILEGATRIAWLPHRNTAIDARYVAIHYTAGSSLTSSINYLRQKGFGYHILIDRDGSVVQGVPLTRRAAHAGYSNWKGLNSLNNHSIGVVLANIGYLDTDGNKYYNTNRHGDLVSPVFDRAEVVVGRHWNGHIGSRAKGWEKYSDAQYQSLRKVCAALVAGFPHIRDVISHEAIAVGRKADPGMAFEWDRITDLFPNRAQDLGPRYRVTVASGDNLNVRRGPNGGWGVSEELGGGRIVHLRSHAYVYQGGTPTRSKWVSVAHQGSLEHAGFVHSDYLRPV